MKKEKSPQLDIEVIKNLYEFGALIVYEVHLFDPLFFKIDTVMRTFSHKAAKKYADSLIKNGNKVEIIEYFVKFHEAYSKKL